MTIASRRAAREATTETASSENGQTRHASPEVATITVVHHPDASCLMSRFALPRGRTTLGRSSSVLGPAALDHQRVSRAHASLQWDGTRLRISDENSHNGTFVNGARISSVDAKPGDVIEIGPLLLLYHFTESAYAVLPASHWVGRSAASARLLDRLHALARADRPVTLLGETGSGKEVAARELHERSGAPGAFVAVNCAAIPDALVASELFGYERGAFSGATAAHPGMFEQAARGTLLLDEIGDASAHLQAALLRVLQEREVRRLGGTKAVPVDARVLAATHRDLRGLGGQGLREDLHARLAGFSVTIPPLRDRIVDVPLLARAILGRLGERRPMHPSFACALLRCPYPRNVRQLEAALAHAAYTTPPSDDTLRLTAETRALLATDGGATGSSTGPATDLRDDADGLSRVLARHEGNVTHAALELGIGRNTLYAWLRRLGLTTAGSK